MGGLAGIFKKVWKSVKNFFEDVFDFIGDILESIMDFLGFHGETIELTDFIAVPMFDDDLYINTRNRLLIERMKNGTDALTYILGFSKLLITYFRKYAMFGEDEYIDRLPETELSTISISIDKVKEVVKQDWGNDNILITSINIVAVYDEDWSLYQLQQLIDFDIGEDRVYLNNKWYKYDDCYYDPNTDILTATIVTISELTLYVYEDTVITITPITGNATQERVTKAVYTRELYVRKDNGNSLYEVTTGPVITTTIENKGLYTPGTETVLISEEDVILPEERITYTIPNSNAIPYYFVKFRDESGRLYYWFYDYTTGKYPELDEPYAATETIDMLPIAVIRTDYKSIDKVDTKRYESTRDLLNCIGLDLDSITEAIEENGDIDKIQAAFFYFGVSPHDTHWVVSQLLYEIFNYVYECLPPRTDATDRTYSCATREGIYNSFIKWKANPVEIIEEHVTNLGEYAHTIEGSTLTVKKQITETTTRVMVLDEFTGGSFRNLFFNR